MTYHILAIVMVALEFILAVYFTVKIIMKSNDLKPFRKLPKWQRELLLKFQEIIPEKKYPTNYKILLTLVWGYARKRSLDFRWR